jgi:4'-phosphopantetheinyl transferase
MALYAITHRCRVGVDLEFVEQLPDLEGVARQFFSSRELDRLHRLSTDERLLAFFIGWTRKEAYLKARGDGLTRSPDQVEVGLESFRSNVLDAADSEDSRDRFWRVDSVLPGAGYVGAVAAEGDDWGIRWLDWQA